MRIGSPMVFQTAPPQPASNARITISPLLEMGQLASQNGLGLRMPAMSVNRSTPGTVEAAGLTGTILGPPRPRASTMERAASLPACTASTTSAPPLTMSPMAQTRALEVRPVAGSAAALPSRTGTPRAVSRPLMAAGPSWPTARTTMSSAMSKRSPSVGTGRRRPEASGSPSVMGWSSIPVTCDVPWISTGATSHLTDTPSERARSMACG